MKITILTLFPEMFDSFLNYSIIARAIAKRPDVLLCDEISLGLAPVVVRDIYAAFPRIRESGAAIVIVEQDIRRLQIAMDNALRVRVGDGVENRPQDRDRLEGGQCPALPQKISQALARHVFKDQIQIAVLLARFENRHDARVAHPADRARLVEQRALVLWI